MKFESRYHKMFVLRWQRAEFLPLFSFSLSKEFKHKYEVCTSMEKSKVFFPSQTPQIIVYFWVNIVMEYYFFILLFNLARWHRILDWNNIIWIKKYYSFPWFYFPLSNLDCIYMTVILIDDSNINRGTYVLLLPDMKMGLLEALILHLKVWVHYS